jgi:hypothetical protein
VTHFVCELDIGHSADPGVCDDLTEMLFLTRLLLTSVLLDSDPWESAAYSADQMIGHDDSRHQS